RMHLVVSCQIGLLRADGREVPLPADLEHPAGGPFALLPGPDLPGEFPEVDLRIEVGRKIAAMASCIDIDDVDRIDAVEIVVMREPGVGVDDARIEARAQDRGDACACALLATL